MGQILIPGYLYWDGFKYILTPGTGGISITGTGLWHETAGMLDPDAYIGGPGQFVLTNSAGSDTSWVTISGDVSASTITPGQLTVTGIQGHTIPTPSGTNTVLEWSGSSFSWGIAGGGFTAGTDLSGTSTSQTVIGIQGHTVPTPSGTNTVLEWSGSSFSWGTVSGFTAGTDLSGTSTSQTVIGLQTYPVSSTAPTANNQLLSWNGSAWIPSPASPAPANNNVLTWSSSSSAWIAAAPGGGGLTVTGSGFVHATASAYNTAATIDGNASHGTSGQFLLTDISAPTSNPDTVWTTLTGDVANSNVTAGLLTVVGIQGNTVTAGALTKGDFFVATTTSNWAQTALSQDVSASVTTPGQITVVGIQTNTVTSGALTKGQFFIASSTTNWAATTLSGDVSESGTTAGQLTVVGLQTHPVSSVAPTANNQLLSWNGSAWIASPASPTPASGNILTWNGSAWAAAAAGSSGLTVTGSGFVHATSSAYNVTATIDGNASHGTSGQFLLTDISAPTSNPDTVWTTLTKDISNSNTTAGQLTVVGIQGNTVTAGALTEGNFLIATSTSNWASTALTQDVSASVATPGQITVTGIQTNTVTSGALTKGNFLIATSTSNWASTALTKDISESNVSPGQLTVVGIQGNTVSSGALTKGQFFVASSTVNWAATTLSGDISESATTAGDLTVVGIQTNTVTSGALTKGQFFVATSTTNWAATTLSGDITESATTAGQLTVAKIQGVAISGTPSAGQVITATSSTAADWATPAGTVTGTGIAHVTSPTGIDSTAYLGTAGYVLTVNNSGTDTQWESLGSDVTGQINNNTVVRLRNRSLSTGNPNGGNVYQWDGSSTWFPNPVDLTNGLGGNITGTLLMANGGTGQNLFGSATGNLLYYGPSAGSSTWLANGTSGYVLTSNGASSAPSWQATGGSSFTAGGDLYGSNTVQHIQTITGGGTSGAGTVDVGASLMTFSSGQLVINAPSVSTALVLNGATGAFAESITGNYGINVATSNEAGTFSSTTALGGNATLRSTNNGSGYAFIAYTANGQGMTCTGTTVGGQFNTTGTVTTTGAPANTSGSVGASSTPVAVLSSYASGNSDNYVHYIDCYANSGSSAVYSGCLSTGVGGNATLCVSSASDARLKENVIDSNLSLSQLEKVQVRSYNFIGSNIKIDGFIAQELREILPSAVLVGGEDPKKNPWMVTQTELIPLLVKAVQELSKKTKQLEKIIKQHKLK
jgi:hypothetical protein